MQPSPSPSPSPLIPSPWTTSPNSMPYGAPPPPQAPYPAYPAPAPYPPSAQPTPVPQQIEVREYKRSSAYLRDANRLGREGWRVVSVTHGTTTHGISWLLLHGQATGRRKRLIVTYAR